MAAALAKGSPTERPSAAPARFQAGDRVRTRSEHVDHHTRLPGYAHGKQGVIESVQGAHVFADTHAQGLGEQPQWLYRVAFSGAELWGDDATPGTSVALDAWEGYLEPASMTTMLLPGMPQDCGEPVFAEPWQAQAFAMALALHQRGLFSWPEWAEALSQADRVGAGHRRCRPGRHLLPALAGRAGNAGRSQGRQLGGRAGTLSRCLGPCGRPHAARPADRLRPEDFSAA